VLFARSKIKEDPMRRALLALSLVIVVPGCATTKPGYVTAINDRLDSAVSKMQSDWGEPLRIRPTRRYSWMRAGLPDQTINVPPPWASS
jgi:hypothetical protein